VTSNLDFKLTDYRCPRPIVGAANVRSVCDS